MQVRQRLLLPAVSLAGAVLLAATAVSASPVVLSKEAATCQQAVGRAGQTFKAAKLRAWRKCLDDTLKGKTCDGAKRNAAIARAEGKYVDAVGKKCTSAVVFAPQPNGVGFVQSCDFEQGPLEPAEEACRQLSVSDPRSLTRCLICWKQAELHELLKILYPCLSSAVPAGSDLDCGTAPPSCPSDRAGIGCTLAIAKAGMDFFLTKEKALERCLDAVRRGKISGPCPDDTTEAAIHKAEVRKAKAIASKCAQLPPWWDVCPEDSTPPCDQTIGNVSDLIECVDTAAEEIADELVCQQYPGAAASGISCPPQEPYCGDGTVNQASEQCDPPGSACPGGQTCQSDCKCPPPPPECGNGTVGPGEQCDPPGSLCPDGQACGADCKCPPLLCGNNVVDAGEDCDPPGSACPSGETCNLSCQCPDCCQIPGGAGPPYCFDTDHDDKCQLMGGQIVPGVCDPVLMQCTPNPNPPPAQFCCDCPGPSFQFPNVCFESPDPQTCVALGCQPVPAPASCDACSERCIPPGSSTPVQAGSDSFMSFATISINVLPNICGVPEGMHVISLSGPTTIQRGPQMVDMIDTEILQLDLTGFDSMLGQIMVHQSPDLNKRSTGMVMNVKQDGAGNFVSGDSFFDVFVTIDINTPLCGQQTLRNDDPVRMQANCITSFPPGQHGDGGCTYTPPPEPGKPLIINGVEIQAGTIEHAAHLAGGEACGPAA